MRRGAGWRSAGSRLPRKQVICALAPYRTAGRGRRRGAAREVAADGPGPPRAGPPGRGPILQWTTIARQGPRLMPVGELGGNLNQPPGDCPSPASAGDFRLSGMKLGPSPEATSSHHQDPEGDTTLTRPWPVVHARGGLRAKAGLSLHRVSAVMKRLSKIGGTSPAPEDH